MDPQIKKQFHDTISRTIRTSVDSHGDPVYATEADSFETYVVYQTKQIINLRGETIKSTISIFGDSDFVDTTKEGDLIVTPQNTKLMPVLGKDRYSKDGQFCIGVIYI